MSAAVWMGLALSVSIPVVAQQPAPVNWDAWRFLLGDWVGEGSGGPGQGTGGFSFAFDLQKQVLVRKNLATYPATKDRPAYSHEDLMIIYQEPSKSTQAIYFDNEGHVIHYTVEFSKDGNAVTFLSESLPAAPRFRLTYNKTSGGTLGIKFEIAPPGKPEAFASYIEATAHRK